MVLKDYQRQVDEWISQYVDGYWPHHEILARLTEEVGELAREVNAVHGHKPKKEGEEADRDLETELADIVFTVICFANKSGFDLDRGFQAVMDKCYGRDSERFEKK